MPSSQREHRRDQTMQFRRVGGVTVNGVGDNRQQQGRSSTSFNDYP